MAGPGFRGRTAASDHSAIPTLFGLGATAFFVTSAIWSLDKGFDLTDEGAYLLGYQAHQPLGGALSNFQLIVRTALGFLTIDILTARLLRLILTLVCVGLIVRSLSVFASDQGLDRYQPRLAAGVLAAGMFASYSFGPQSLSYNHLALLLATLHLVLAVWLVSPRFSLRSRYLAAAAWGVVTVLTVQIKFTSGLAFLGFGLLLYWVAFGGRRREFFLALAVEAGAVVASLLGYFIFFQSPGEMTAMFDGARRYSMAHSDYGWRQIAADFARFVATSGGLVGLMVSVYLGRVALRRVTSLRLVSTGLPLLLGAVVLLTWHSRADVLRWGHAFYLPALAAAAGSVVGTLAGGRKSGWPIDVLRAHSSRIVIMLLLYLSPTFIALGSNNGVQVVSVVGAGFAYGLWLIWPRRDLVRHGSLAMAMVAYAVCCVGRNLVLFPYRQAPLTRQTELLDFLPHNRLIRVDPETHGFIRGAYDLAGVVPGSRKSILALYRLPGLVYLLGASSPGGLAWSESTNDVTVENLLREGGSLPDVIVSEEPQINGDLVARFAAAGVDLKHRYHVVGRLAYQGRVYHFLALS